MKKRLARTCNLDGSDPKVFVLPGPQIISRITVHPDGRATAELTDYGKRLLGPPPSEELDPQVAQLLDQPKETEQ